MKQITIPELVKLCAAAKNPVTRQAVHKAIKSGLFPFGDRGGKKYIDLDNPAVQEYIHGTNRQREAVTAAKKQASKPGKTQSHAKLPAQKHGKAAPPSGDENLEAYEMSRRQKYAEMRKKELQVLIIEKNYISIKFCDDVYMKYINELNSKIERIAATYINDVGKKILEKGEILPEHIEEFRMAILKATHENKLEIDKAVKKYEPVRV